MATSEPRLELTSSAVGYSDESASEARECVVRPLQRPYRPIPRNFVRRWPEVGWGGAELEWRCHARTVARWVDECGRDQMVLARKRWLEEQRATRSRAKRYVLGKTLGLTRKPKVSGSGIRERQPKDICERSEPALPAHVPTVHPRTV